MTGADKKHAGDNIYGHCNLYTNKIMVGAWFGAAASIGEKVNIIGFTARQSEEYCFDRNLVLGKCDLH